MGPIELNRCIQTCWHMKLLEKRGGSKEDRNLPSEEREEETETSKVLICLQCRKYIADEAWRISVEGGHRHTFANPHGFVYEIGCFESAAGCVGIGPTSNEFAWFKGYSWQVVICAGCMTHLGWFFKSSGLHHFYGLILDRLISSF